MTEDTDKTLLVEKTGYLVTLIFNRPEKRNALSYLQLIKLHEVLDNFSKNDDVRCVIFRGSGDASFSSGYDISAIPTKVSPKMQETLKNHNPLELALNSIKNFPYPTIAMMNGYAFGAGFNLCVCCDIRIAVDGARMGMPPAKLGLVYHPGGLQQFIEVYGISRTKEIFLTGRTFKGAEILQKGLVDHMVPDSELETFTLDYAQKITQNAPLSLKGMKKIINMFGEEMTLGGDRVKQAEELSRISFQSDDLIEGQTAFLEKRKPRFTGK
jgi:enoyl-CoA hydratase